MQLKCTATKSCPTLCDPMDWSLPGSSVHEILQAISFSRGSSPPRGQTHDSCLAARFSTTVQPGKSQVKWQNKQNTQMIASAVTVTIKHSTFYDKTPQTLYAVFGILLFYRKNSF